MRVFVASWFFPPATSSEGIVAFKLLKASKNQYDVCSSLSDQWGYEQKLECSSENIRTFPVATGDLQVWVDEAIALFRRLHNEKPYDVVMTRSMPPESIDVGLAIKREYPDIPWVASLGDPIARVPWMMKAFLGKKCKLSPKDRQKLKSDLALPVTCDQWMGRGDPGVDTLCQYKKWEVSALQQADAIIVPSGPQVNYMLCGKRGANVAVIPHSYDPALFPKTDVVDKADNSVVEFAFLGSTDESRSLEPLVKALHRLQIDNPNALDKVHFRFIGNINDSSSALIYNYNLLDVVSVEPSVSYSESLRIMQEVDWLVYVDGNFNEFKDTGGSVYMAGKLADYLGSGKPILAMTGGCTPADRLVRQAGGFSVDSWNSGALSAAIERIANGTLTPEINWEYRKGFASERQAEKLDGLLEDVVARKLFCSCHRVMPECRPSLASKTLTICIPSYNVEETLDRCLYSLVSSGRAEALQIVVVNDGSNDRTRDIALLYQSKYPGIVELLDKENGGHGSTVNAAMGVARGAYFRIVDGDDWLEPAELGNLISYLEGIEERGEQVDLISSNYAQVDMKTGKLNRVSAKGSWIEYDKIYDIAAIDISDEYFSNPSITYRTQILRDSGLRLSENTFYVDVEYQMMTLPWVKKVAFTRGELYRYAVGNSTQSISYASFVKRYENHERVMKRVIRFYYEHKDELAETVDEYYWTLLVKYLLKTHYSIALIFDDDREQGLGRAKAFDCYLKAEHRDLYDEVGRMYSAIAAARKESYSADKLPKFGNLNYKAPTAVKKAARSITRKVMKGQVGGIVASEVTRRQKRR